MPDFPYPTSDRWSRPSNSSREDIRRIIHESGSSEEASDRIIDYVVTTIESMRPQEGVRMGYTYAINDIIGRFQR